MHCSTQRVVRGPRTGKSAHACSDRACTPARKSRKRCPRPSRAAASARKSGASRAAGPAPTTAGAAGVPAGATPSPASAAPASGAAA
eukprot:1353507-Pyramimonas_sp.AAC.1